MSRLQELERLADACDPLPFDPADYQCLAEKRDLADYVRKNHATIKQMVAIMRQMRDACESVTHQFYHRKCEAALAAFDKFDKGE